MTPKNKKPAAKATDSSIKIIPTKTISTRNSSKSDRDLLEEMLKKLDEMKVIHDDMKERQKKMELQLLNMDKQLKSKDETIAMLERNELNMKQEINELKQRSRFNNIIIKGIPGKKDEDILKVVTDLGNKIGIMNAANDIQRCHRVPTFDKTKTKPIVVRLLNSRTRDEWIQAYKNKKLWNEKIYVNEHLTPENFQLFLEAKKQGKSNNIKFVWTKDCKIFMRKSENSKVKVIKKLEDIDYIIMGEQNMEQNTEISMSSDTDEDNNEILN